MRGHMSDWMALLCERGLHQRQLRDGRPLRALALLPSPKGGLPSHSKTGDLVRDERAHIFQR